MKQQAADWMYAMEREQTENLPFHTLTLYIYQFFFYKHLKYKKCFFPVFYVLDILLFLPLMNI